MVVAVFEFEHKVFHWFYKKIQHVCFWAMIAELKNNEVFIIVFPARDSVTGMLNRANSIT